MFSRLIVAYEVWETQKAEYAEHLVKRAILAQGIRGRPLVLHSDNGSPMKAATFIATLDKNLRGFMQMALRLVNHVPRGSLSTGILEKISVLMPIYVLWKLNTK